MPFEAYADTCSNSLMHGMGEVFDIYFINNDEEPVLEGVLGVYDETFLESDIAEVSTATIQPNVLIRDADLQGRRLTGKRYRLHHISQNVLYNIVGILRDDASTTRYFVQEYKEKVKDVAGVPGT